MTRFLRVDCLAQETACPGCGGRAPVGERRRKMNFTTNVVQLLCAECRAEVGRIRFGRWNALHAKADASRKD